MPEIPKEWVDRINKDKIILDLCGGTGAWSIFYKRAGYDVRLITLPHYNIKEYNPPKNVYGILAAPPCTQFSFARTKAKELRNLRDGFRLVYVCLEIIWTCQYRIETNTQKKAPLKFWALENPNGFLKYFLGKPAFIFDPWEFGNMWKKKTHLWGWFNNPKKTILEKPNLPKFGSDKPIEFRFNADLKSITPSGFAKAFFEANK